ncbi:MAG TPA: hypothetical protein VN365_01100 [Candidatus Thermoplasmatota archaeon]|nr:hypothetical protein [Candidatus Thermoplasmatota archaeon]
MKKMLPIVITAILVLSGLGASALPQQSLQPTVVTMDQQLDPNPSPRDYTHTVLVEVGTATWCPSCPQSNAAWHSIYGQGTYDFEYTELVDDKNTDAAARFNEFNPKYVPTSYWDAGMFAYPGTSQSTFITYLNNAGARVVPDLVATLSAAWLGNAQMQINYSVQNNEATNYPGKLRIYVQELESRWDDYSGNPYHHALIDMAKNIVIDIPAGNAISDSFTWSGSAAGYPDVTMDNLQVILGVFDDEAHTGYSDPPSGNPFNAYYSDECIAVLPTGDENDPPSAPTIQGPTTGVEDVTYTFTISSVDPEGDNVFYCANWSDDTGEICVGPFASGVPVEVTHTWATPGTYLIKFTSHDVNNAESDTTTHEIIISEAPAIGIAVAGGFGLKATLTNNGLIDLTKINWSITLDGGLILAGKTTTGTIPGIESGAERIVKPSLVLGFGKTTITVSATSDEGVAANTTASGFVLGPFVLGVK